MKKSYLLYYALMILLNLLPALPLSVKGILGLIFIVVSCVWFSFKDGKLTAALWIILGFINYFLGINVDYKFGITSMLLGTVLYCITAYYLGISIDTLRKRNSELKDEVQRKENTEKELNEKLTLIQSLMDTIPSPIFLKDMDCRYIKCNRAFEDSIGIKESDLKDKSAYDIFIAELAKTYNEMELELLDSEGVHVYESVMSFADGSLRSIILNEALFKNASGKPLGIVGVITDITDKKESELLMQKLVEKKRYIDEIVEYGKMKNEFFANISHELRTPLNVILGSIQLVEMYSRSNTYNECQTKVVRNIAIMKQNCYRLLRLINNLIDITKIDARSFELRLKNHNIVNIVEEITLSVSEYVENNGMKLVFDTDVEEKVMACDAEKIERIMLNLLSNAVKFTPKGGNVLVSIHDKCDILRVQVSDSGIGIPQDKLSEIFCRYCQISNILSREHEGSGIGLNLVKSLVEMHGGSISVESELERGTVFTIDLPVRIVSVEEHHHIAAEKQNHVERIQIEFSDIYSVC